MRIVLWNSCRLLEVQYIIITEKYMTTTTSLVGKLPAGTSSTTCWFYSLPTKQYLWHNNSQNYSALCCSVLEFVLMLGKSLVHLLLIHADYIIFLPTKTMKQQQQLCCAALWEFDLLLSKLPVHPLLIWCNNWAVLLCAAVCVIICTATWGKLLVHILSWCMLMLFMLTK